MPSESREVDRGLNLMHPGKQDERQRKMDMASIWGFTSELDRQIDHTLGSLTI